MTRKICVDVVVRAEDADQIRAQTCTSGIAVTMRPKVTGDKLGETTLTVCGDKDNMNAFAGMLKNYEKYHNNKARTYNKRRAEFLVDVDKQVGS